MLSDRDGPPPPDKFHNDGLIPQVVPPLPREKRYARELPWHASLQWLRAGWSDLRTNPSPSLLYGLGVFIVSLLVVWSLFRLQISHFVFPALAGFMVLGPLIANGLYEKSRRLENGDRVTFGSMLFVKMRSGYSAFFMGALLLALFMLWIRAAVLIYALFFGVIDFLGMDEMVPVLFTTPSGWGMLIVGCFVGALFAAFAFAISVFAVPMLLEEDTDALTALGTSVAMVWNNRRVMLAWGTIVLALFTVSVLTGFVGLILIFPVLGHATWHAYRTIRGSHPDVGETERMFIQPA